MRNGDSLAIGEGAQQMPVHHGLSDSCGLSAGAKAAGHTQWTVTLPFPYWPSLDSSGPPRPPWLACGDRPGSWGSPLTSVLSEHIYFQISLAKVRIRFSLTLLLDDFSSHRLLQCCFKMFHAMSLIDQMIQYSNITVYARHVFTLKDRLNYRVKESNRVRRDQLQSVVTPPLM